MKYYIAIDSGGTKTDTVLFDATGHILRRYVGPGGNPLDLGAAEAVRRLNSCINEVADGFDETVSSLYGGIAGVTAAGDVFSGKLDDSFRIESTRFEDDGSQLVTGTLGHADGCGMVCGTGSSLFARTGANVLHHIGGKGYLIDTGGSGFELGRDAICMAFRAHDGRAPKTVLNELFEDIFKEPFSDLYIAKVHKGGRPLIASFAGLVFEGLKRGDATCSQIVDRGASLLADLTYAAEQYFPGQFKVVMSGGIFSHFPEYTAEVIRRSSPQAIMIPAEVPAVYGAAVEAVKDDIYDPDDSFKNNFLNDYRSYEKGSSAG